jgi:hypothetical protein
MKYNQLKAKIIGFLTYNFQINKIIIKVHSKKVEKINHYKIMIKIILVQNFYNIDKLQNNKLNNIQYILNNQILLVN